MMYKQIIDNFRQATPLENSFQEYNVLSNVINSENLSNHLQLDEPIDLNFGQNYQADAQKSSNGPKRRGRPRGSTTIKRNTENSSEIKKRAKKLKLIFPYEIFIFFVVGEKKLLAEENNYYIDLGSDK
ncbi:hypothetical protein BpHYR1_022913 [Brachionus plicatilis]|uniref:Uncharacterized protein n=1 Tax=Brachionus plicatilis TaxID=10195 RepID=A0A3M7T615_BRAPC|nr:hypothetical protein BpHYR1_022913 [Brachionus plicatilis]